MNKRLICALMALILTIVILLPTSAFAAGRETAVSNAKNAVVRLMMEDDDGNIYTGSAFAIGEPGKDPEYFITNAHNCLNDNGKLMKNIYILLDSSAVTITTIPVLDDDLLVIGTLGNTDFDKGKMVKCSVVNESTIDWYPDVAVIHASKPISGRSTLKLAKTSDDLRETQTVHALGFPGDLDDIQAGAFSLNLKADPSDVNFTTGNVAQKLKGGAAFGNTDMISHTAQIVHGNSGGPLLDDNGVVVGINTYGVDASTAGTDGNYYFSVYIDYAIDILKTNNIPFVTAGRLSTRDIVLIAAMILIAVVAVLLILSFSKKKNAYTQHKKDVESQALRIQGLSGVFAGRRFTLENQVTFGRAPSNNIVFPTTTKGVSGNHCVVINNNGQVYVKDTGSSNGTYVNGTTKLPANQLVSIKVGDRISLGSEAETFMITRKGGKV